MESRQKSASEIIGDCAEYLVQALSEAKMTITAVESCTGGMVAAALTSVPGSSRILRQSFVTYCDDAKHRLAGVKKETLERYTAVSRQTAQEMAEGGAKAAGADLCVSVTGYAGPASGDEETGLVYIGCASPKGTVVKEFHFPGGRGQVRMAACAQALLMAKEAVLSA